jgi:hypothetical protein
MRVATGPRLGAVLVAVAVLVGALVLRGIAPWAGTKPEPSPSPNPSATALPSTEASPLATEPSPSLPVTPMPSVVISGELPGPEATVPPGYRVMPVGVEAFAATALALGMSCDETIRETGFAPDDYGLACHGREASARAEYSAVATFWTLDGIWLIDVDVVADSTDTGITDPSIGGRIVLPFVALLGGEAARDWASGRIDDLSCPPGGCKRSFSGVLLFVTGSDGSGSLHARMAGPTDG